MTPSCHRDVVVSRDYVLVLGGMVQRTSLYSPSQWMRCWEGVKMGHRIGQYEPEVAIDAYADRVVICRQVVHRPPAVVPSEWLKFWERVTRCAE